MTCLPKFFSCTKRCKLVSFRRHSKPANFPSVINKKLLTFLLQYFDAHLTGNLSWATHICFINSANKSLGFKRNLELAPPNVNCLHSHHSSAQNLNTHLPSWTLTPRLPFLSTSLFKTVLSISFTHHTCTTAAFQHLGLSNSPIFLFNANSS